jgi:hypothetical protein
MKIRDLKEHMMKSKQWLEGYNAFWDGIHKCPYKKEDQSYGDWQDGYHHAMNED